MPRPLWKGDISFGLVNIPVETLSRRGAQEFKFSMLDKRDFSPVGYKRYSKKTNKEVEWANIVKGYEYDKDQYVVLSDEDFRRANIKASQTIDIQAFVPASEIPVQYFDTPYYLAPTERGKKVYALLRETLHATGRVAVAQVVIRTAQHLAAVVPVGRALMLNTMRYSDQLRHLKKFTFRRTVLRAPGNGQGDRAGETVGDRHGGALESRRIQGYTYPVDLMRRINGKIKKGENQEITETGDDDEDDKPRSAQIIDLAALLQQSLKDGGRGAKKTEAPRSTAAKPMKAVVRSLPRARAAEPKAKRKSA